MENYQDLKRLTWMALAMLATLSCGSRLNVVTDWNTIASTTIVKNGGKASTPSGVWFAYTSLAVYAAVNAITGQYRTFYYQGAGPRTVSVEAAAAGAAHGILVNYFPGQSDLDARLAPTLSNVSADQGAKDAGASPGEPAAAAVSAARRGD